MWREPLIEDIHYTIVAPGSVVEWSPRLQRIYETIYAVEPGTANSFIVSLTEHSDRSGFSCVAAISDDEVVGFGYGFTGQAGQPWCDQMIDFLGDGAPAWVGRHFEFAEFGVAPNHRRRGVATNIYDRLLSAVENQHWILTARVGNVPAISFYEQRGWNRIRAGFVSDGGAGPYDIWGLERNQV